MYSLYRYLLSFILLFYLSLAEAAAQQKQQDIYYPEPGHWEHRSPASVGMNDQLISEAITFAQKQESEAPKDLEEAHYLSFGQEPFGFAIGPFKERGAATGLIIKNGYIVAEWGDPQRVDQTFSVAKSFLSTTVGLAYDRGMIQDINDKVYAYMAPVIPYTPYSLALDKSESLGQPDVLEPFETEHNRKITWNHLLRQTSDWEGTLWGKPDWADRPQGETNTWMSRKRNEPGTVYKYNDVRVNVLALAIMNVWRRPLPQVLKEYVMDLIGASNTWRWLGYENSWIVMDGVPMQAVSGGSHWGGGMMISAMDQARFGYLTLRRGRWKDQQILSDEWIQMALTPTPAEKTYGFMNFFLNTDKAFLSSAPASAFTHVGAGTNMIYIDPEHDLIIIARWIKGDAMNGVVERVLKSLEQK